jgi:hypothetical protein
VTLSIVLTIVATLANFTNLVVDVTNPTHVSTLVGNVGSLVGDIIDTNYELTKESMIAIVNTYSTT